MKYNYFSRSVKLVGLALGMMLTRTSFAQCSIDDLAPTFCADGGPVILSGTPAGGIFSGSGVSGNVFEPSVAGVGTHTITYSYYPGGDRYYLRSNGGDPWGNTTNNTAMTTAFGADWSLDFFETVDVAAVFSPSTSFVFLDGSDAYADELNSFLTANLPTIEAWVNAGGAVLINAAPNEGADINFGFGGTTLNYSSMSSTVNAVDATHPVFLGPELPTATTMTGTSYGHARILGTGYTNILTNGANVVLCEKAWGSGVVMVGGMTTVNYHSPTPEAQNFRPNLFVYLDNYTPIGAPCVSTVDVEVLDETGPALTATVDNAEICLGESYTLTGSGAPTLSWGGGIEDGVAITPESPGIYTHLLTGVSAVGCTSSESVSVTIHALPVVDAGLDQTFCEGTEATLTATGAPTLTWTGGITNGVPFLTEAGETTYTVTGTDANGCEDTDEVIVTGIEPHEITATIYDEYTAYGASIDVEVTGGVGTFAYLWSHGPTTQDVEGLTEGTYTVTVDDLGVEDGICKEVSATYTVQRFIGVKENADALSVTVYPSPASDNITVSFKGNFAYEVTALNGTVIYNGNAVDQQIISVKELAAGTYVVNVLAGNQLYSKKVVKK